MEKGKRRRARALATLGGERSAEQASPLVRTSMGHTKSHTALHSTPTLTLCPRCPRSKRINHAFAAFPRRSQQPARASRLHVLLRPRRRHAHTHIIQPIEEGVLEALLGRPSLGAVEPAGEQSAELRTL